MTGCACQYPKFSLQTIKKKFNDTKELSIAHRMLQEQLESFLKDELNLDSKQITEIITNGWGLAGILKSDRIIAIKIPRSDNLIEYPQETDPERKRQLYCHCPRIRDVLKSSEKLSPTYCYCGAGFYKGIWEEILQKPVDIELLECILKNDDVCKFVIYLPSEY